MSANVDDLVDALLVDHPPASTAPTEFLGEQFDRGLAWVHFPAGCGGLGGSPADQLRTQRRLLAGGAPMAMLRNVIGYGMVAPTLVTHGTDRQRDRYLRPLFTGEEVWCQLFSEPGAGSDVAGLATRAVHDGDEWVVNGQKVWTTLAHLSRFGLLLARTDPEANKHSGMTMFLVDMHGAGVDVRPLYQITGEAEFNECFFTDARIPEEDRLGGIGRGLARGADDAHERAGVDRGELAHRGALARSARPCASTASGSPATPTRAPRCCATRCLRALRARRGAPSDQRCARSDARRRGTPGPEGSVAKLAFAEENKRIYELCVDLMGADGMLVLGRLHARAPDAHRRSARRTCTRRSCVRAPTRSKAARPR